MVRFVKASYTWVLVLIFGHSTRPCISKEKDVVGDIFAKFIGYQPRPMVGYIQGTKTWQEGHRDILDWGCGGGRLSQQLAMKGATKVVAVDMNANAINATRTLLKPFPQSIARGPRSFARGAPGQLGYYSDFDIVVSLCGALSEGTTGAGRIEAAEAMQQAVNACREGGLVLVGEIVERKHYKNILVMVLASTFGWSKLAPWIWNCSELQQYVLWYLMTLPFVGITGTNGLGNIPTVVIARNIARSFLDREWRASSIIFSWIWLFFPGRGIAHHLRDEYRHRYEQKMALKKAGLVNIKQSSRYMIFLFEAVRGKDASSVAKKVANRCNMVFYPGAFLLISQGEKPRT